MAELSFETPEFLELVNDEKFKEKVAKQKSPEDIRNLFSKKGINMTDDQFKEFIESVKVASGEEVKSKFLDKISGGKTLSESVAKFIDEHPWLTYWTVCTAIAAPAAIVGASQAGRTCEALARKSEADLELERLRRAR